MNYEKKWPWMLTSSNQSWVSNLISQSSIPPHHTKNGIWKRENPNHNKIDYDLPFPIKDLICIKSFKIIEMSIPLREEENLFILFWKIGSCNCLRSPNLAYKNGLSKWFDKRFEISTNLQLISHSQSKQNHDCM